MLTDTHAHLNFNAYKKDLNEVIKRSLENGVEIINIGSQYETSKRAVEIAERYEKGIYAAVGFHPTHAATDLVKVKMDPEEVAAEEEKEKEFSTEKYRLLAKSKKVVAIGEIGLDYWYRPKTKIKTEQFKERQKNIFLKQLDLAKELNLPVIFHCRVAHDDLIEILSQQSASGVERIKGVIHCFTGGWEQAKKYLEMGFYLGFNGIIFKLDLNEIVEKAPLDKILIETDCPYLVPPLARRSLEGEGGRNEPIFVKYVAKKIAEIKKVSFEKVAETTTQNARNLFGI